MRKPFWIPLMSATATIVALYVIGFMTNIEFLRFSFSPSYTDISLIPIIIGFIIGFIVEWIMRKKPKATF